MRRPHWIFELKRSELEEALVPRRRHSGTTSESTWSRMSGWRLFSVATSTLAPQQFLDGIGEALEVESAVARDVLDEEIDVAVRPRITTCKLAENTATYLPPTARGQTPYHAKDATDHESLPYHVAPRPEGYAQERLQRDAMALKKHGRKHQRLKSESGR
jgi:hypothetical protein